MRSRPQSRSGSPVINGGASLITLPVENVIDSGQRAEAKDMKGNLPMRLLLAARLSQMTRGGETGIETQDEDAREWAEDNGHEIIAVAADTKSGPTPMWDRPNLRPWVTDPAHMAAYDGIVAAKQDRLSRADWRDEAELRIWAENNGKTLFIVDRKLRWPPRNADDMERWNNGAEQARREWENTSKRYKRMLKSKRDKGYFTGKRPYGYRIVPSEDGHGKILEQDPDAAPIVREMANRYDEQNQSLREIAQWLTDSSTPVSQQGNRTHQGKWSAQTVRNILTNSAIMGRVRINGVTTHHIDRPIIQPEQFRRIQDKMAARAHHGAPSGSTALLTSILICSNGHSMHRLKAHPTSKLPNGRFYYYCRECPKGQRPFIWCDETDQAVNEAVTAIADMEHVIKTVVPGDTYGDEIHAIKKEIAALDPEDEDWGKRTTALRAEIAELRGHKRKAPKVIKKKDTPSVGQVWESLTPAERRLWLLARRGSDWLPGQDKAKVQCLGRDAETGLPIMVIDLGEYTETAKSLEML
jgi:DNA invertase Pin-like site-specific DNA recombinase